jgi:nitroimidazol reductase NimA-like FMN-containing flavoprotein (pyridoxamine 5'-phosphate oxidase superfamily)
MKEYAMRNMRRKDRQTSRDFALSIVDKCLFAVMATVNDDGSPYCIPLSIARSGEWIYFHCAREGHKTDNLRGRNRVCLSCVGDTHIPEGKFTIEYESAIVFGTAQEVSLDEEKIHALRLICQRYTPANMAAFDEAIERSLAVTAIWKIHIDEISGKQKAPAKPA